uniref:SUZ-C domain-containing protein n=1 Tax=Phasianus colchicus TaxID=9054 RepID=A0A669Q741_PHACC
MQRTMGGPMAVPVSVLRLPRGPDGSGRGFSSTTPNRRGEAPEVTEVTKATQATRAALRRRFLLSLAAARGQTATFVLCQHGRVGGNDGSAAAAFQVDALQTPLGVQRAALLRGRDVVAFGFQMAEK